MNKYFFFFFAFSFFYIYTYSYMLPCFVKIQSNKKMSYDLEKDSCFFFLSDISFLVSLLCLFERLFFFFSLFIVSHNKKKNKQQNLLLFVTRFLIIIFVFFSCLVSNTICLMYI